MISGVTEMILKKLNVEDISANIANITTRLTALDATIHDMQATSVTSGSLTSTGEVSLVMFQDLSSNVLSTMTDVNNLLEKIVDLSNNSAHTGLFTELSTKIDTLESAINDSSARITDISGVVDSNVQQITALTGDVAIAAQQITGLSGDLATTQQQLSNLSTASTSQAQQLTDLSGATTAQAQQLTDLSTTTVAQTQQISTLSETTATHTQQIADLSANMVSGQATVDSAQITDLSGAIELNRDSISGILDNVFHESDASGNVIITQSLYPKVSALKRDASGTLVANKDENNVVLGYNLGGDGESGPRYWNSVYTKELFMHGNTIHVQTETGSHVNWSWDGSGNSYFTMAEGDGDDGHNESETTSSVQFKNVITDHGGQIDPALLPFTGLRFRGIIAADGPDASGQVLTEREVDASGGDYYVIDTDGRIEYEGWDTSVRDVSAGDIAIYADPPGHFVKVRFALPAGHIKTQHIFRHAITGNEIAPDSITSDKIAPGTVIASDISDNSITGAKIDSSTTIDVSAITLGGVDIFSDISGDIVALQGRVTTLEADVVTHTQNITDISDNVAANAQNIIDLSANVSANTTNISTNAQAILDLSNNGTNTQEFTDLSANFYDLSGVVSQNTQAILDLSENGVGSSAPNPLLNAFFEAMTQQPKKFLFDKSDNTTNTIDVSWTIDNSGGVLDWDLAMSGLNIQHIDSIVLQIRNNGASSWSNVSTDVGSSTRAYQFDLGTSYGGITLASNSTIDIRLYGVNQAKSDAGGSIDDRALEMIGLAFKGAGLPIQPTATVTTPTTTTTISITVSCSDVDIDDATASTLKIKAYDISYNAYETYRDNDWNGTADLFDNSQLTKTDNSFGPYTQTQISGGQAFNLTDTIYPGTSYQFQIRVKNDSNNDWSAFSSVYTTAKTKLPSVLSTNPTTITNCFNITNTQTTFWDENATATVTNGYYINKSTTSSILTFDKDDSTPIRFELTDRSTDPEANTKYGSKITSETENLATLTVASSSVNSGKAIGDTIYFRKNSTSGTNTNYFSNLVSEDPNSNQNSGFRRQGKFNLVDITTSYFDPDNNSHTITYSLSGSANSTIDTSTSYTFYVDELVAPGCSFSGTSESTPTSFKYNCGIQSVEYFKITTGVINVTNINSTYKFLPTGDIITVSSTESDVSTISASTTRSSFTPINSTGTYNWPSQTISSLCFKAANLSSSTIAINAASTNLRTTSSSVSNNVTLNMFCDYGSFNKSGDRITTTKCPAFYELNDPDHLDNLSSLSFSLYDSTHQTAIEQWTPLFCGGEFATKTKSTGHYIDYDIFESDTGANLSGPDYSNMNSYLKTGGVDNTNGYKWIVFKATGPTEANAKTLYESIGIDVSGTWMRSVDNVEVYIYKDGKWGNLTKGMEFDSTDVWWGNSPAILSEAKGVWDDSYSNKIRLANDTGGDVYFMIGLKNSVSLSLIK